MRPPSKRGTAAIPVEQRRNSAVFKKISLRSWQAQYKALRASCGKIEQPLAQPVQS
jgi:hypothetical protein